MKVLVIVRQVPDSTTQIKIRSDGQDIDRSGVKMVVNPFDEFAIEVGAQLREKRQDVPSLTALVIGPAAAGEALRTALAVGADEGIHLDDPAFEGLDELQIASLIALVAKAGGYDLILVSKQEIDLDSGQTGPALAELLDAPHVGATVAVDIAADGKSLTARRRIEGAEEVVQITLPAVLTCDKGLPEMRYPSLPNLMKAKKKPVKIMKAGDVAGFDKSKVGGVKYSGFELPPPRPPGKLIEGEPEQTAAQLVKLLREEAKSI